jgi:hypothetical protein
MGEWVKCWVAVSVMTLLLAGCGTQEEGASSKEEPPGEETSAEAFPQSSASSQQDLSIGDTATFEYGDTVTVYSYNAPVQSNNEFINRSPATSSRLLTSKDVLAMLRLQDQPETPRWRSTRSSLPSRCRITHAYSIRRQ